MDNSAWLPFDKVAFTDDMMFSATWSVQNRTSRREQRRVFIQILQETTSRWQPLQDQLKMSTVPHQHNLVDINVALVITIMYLFIRQDNMLPARLLQSHNWADTRAATGAFVKFQGDKPPMTREGNCSSNKHRQSFSEDFRQALISGPLLQSCLEEEAKGWATSAMQQQQIDATLPNGRCPAPAFSIKQAASKLRRIDDTREA